jgi:hypothetical protein
MAAAHRQAVRRAAELVVTRLDLRPPVDIRRLLRDRVARLERLDWPQDNVDAILTGLDSDPSSLAVFIRESDNPQRERFTMAHEFAHIVIPWHIPAPTCTVDDQHIELDARALEREADLFASCLLVPDRWLADVIGAGEPDMESVLAQLAEADVSTAAALQALRRYLLPG